MKVKLMNVEIDNMTIAEAVSKIILYSKSKNLKYVVTPNVDHIVKLSRDQEFKVVYNKSDLVLADGMPILWASKILGNPIMEKISGADLLPEICRKAEKEQCRIFLLGSASQQIIEKTASNLMLKFPHLKIVGMLSPTIGFEKKEEENKRIIEEINKSKADILFVGVGAPKQEKWIHKHKDNLQVGVALGIGAAFDFIAGNVKRAPLWMQKNGLEWLYRFLQEPTRLFKRYFIDDMYFFILLIKEVIHINLASKPPKM